MNLFRPNINPSEWRVTINEEEVTDYVLASEELGAVAFQTYPANWQVGDPAPPEVWRAGTVRIQKIVQLELELRLRF